jgi:hypothetical protein
MTTSHSHQIDLSEETITHLLNGNGSDLSFGDDDLSWGALTNDELFANNSPHPSKSTMTETPVPRMVSVDSMSQVQTHGFEANIAMVSSTTPYDSLKDLVQRKKSMSTLQRSSHSSNSPVSANMLVVGNQNASFHDVPVYCYNPQGTSRIGAPSFSKILRQSSGMTATTMAIYKQGIANAPIEPISKRRKLDSSIDNLPLHQACVDAKQNGKLIETVVRKQPLLASVPAKAITSKSIYDFQTSRLERKSVTSTYRYPLNIAIQHDADVTTIEALLRAAPFVVTTPDGGVARECSLHVLLRHKTHDLQSIDLCLLQTPNAVSCIDRHANTPLHTACAKHASIDVIRHLTVMYPEALGLRNFHGYTPLEIAQRSQHTTDEVLDYLWDSVSQQLC